MNEFQLKMKERAEKFNQASTTVTLSTASQDNKYQEPKKISSIPVAQPKKISPTIPVTQPKIIEVAKPPQTKPTTKIESPVKNTGELSAIEKYKLLLQQNNNKNEIPTPVVNKMPPPTIKQPEIEKPIVKPIVNTAPQNSSSIQTNIDTTSSNTAKLKEIYKNMPLMSNKPKSTNEGNIAHGNVASGSVKLYLPKNSRKQRKFNFDTDNQQNDDFGFNHLIIEKKEIVEEVKQEPIYSQQLQVGSEMPPQENIIQPLAELNLLPVNSEPVMQPNTTPIVIESNIEHRNIDKDAFDDDDDDINKPIDYANDKLVLEEKDIDELDPLSSIKNEAKM